MSGFLNHKKRIVGNSKFFSSKISKLSLVVIIVSLASSMVNTIWSAYINSFLASPAIVGLFTAGLTIISFLSYFLFIPLMERFNKAKIYTITLIVLAIIYSSLSFKDSLMILVPFAIIASIVGPLRLTSFGIILRDNSKKKKVSGNFGLIYSLAAVAWIIGPLIVGFISKNNGLRIVFSVSSLLLLTGVLVFRTSKINDNNIKKRVDRDFSKNFKAFFSDKERLKVYILNGGSTIFLVLTYLFMPLYILSKGLSFSWVSIFLFSYAIIPAFGEYLFGRMAGKIGYKKIFVVGFSLMAVIGILAFFINNPFIIMGLIVLSSLGVAMTESTTDSYFLDITNKKDELRFYGPYNTAIDLFDSVVKFIPGIILLFLPFSYVFLIFGIIMIYMAFVSSTIKDKIEDKE